jgi:glyoxalase family protein
VEFEDPEGQRLALVDDGGAGPAHPWRESPVPAEHQIRGLGQITLSVPDLAPTKRVLESVMEMAEVRSYGLRGGGSSEKVHVFKMAEGGPETELHVAGQPNLAPARQGAGGVHHVAFRTPNDTVYDAWAARLNQMGLRNSGKVDRFYFRSLYFREPNGILFEIATDGPGFHADEPMEHLGERLALPPFPRRKARADRGGPRAAVAGHRRDDGMSRARLIPDGPRLSAAPARQAVPAPGRADGMTL